MFYFRCGHIFLIQLTELGYGSQVFHAYCTGDTLIECIEMIDEFLQI